MILTGHQTQYLPGLRLFDKIAASDSFVYLDTVQVEDSGWENRNSILTQNGPQWLTVPIKRSRDLPAKDIEIADGPWRRKHWRSIELAYQKAPYFDKYATALKLWYDGNWTHLAELNLGMLRFFMDVLGIDIPVTRASTLGLEGTKSELVLDMCKKMGATEYIFGAKGRDYADVATFERAGIAVRFQDYKHPEYPQHRRGFVSNLSIVDLIMNCGERSLEILRTTPPASLPKQELALSPGKGPASGAGRA